MSPARHQPTRLESIIAIVLIIVPLIVLIAIFNMQKGADISRFGIQTPIAEKSPDEQPIDFVHLAPKGFKPFGTGESYNEKNLYEKINGKAPLYTESGFVKLFVRRYVSQKDDELTFELYIYDMGTAANAFSVYSIQRRAEGSPIDDMPSAYRTENALYLTHGKYYCELIGSSGSPVLLDALDLTATGLIENLKKPGPGRIPEFAFLPNDNLIPNTFILYLNGAFGFAGLTNTLSAKYDINDQTVTAFVSKQSGPAAAEKLADEYTEFLLTNGGEKIVSTDPASTYVDFYGSLEIVSAEDSFVFGIHQADDRMAAKIILALIRDHLAKEIQ
jgi:hypothetical protein